MLLLAGFLPLAAKAQYPVKQRMTVPVTRVQAVAPAYLELNSTNEQLRQDYLLNERVVDLVEVMEIDSVLKLKTQRHRVGPVGWFIRMAGYCWRSVNMRRVKVVGTMHGGFSGSDKDRFTEYDINFNLVPHLKPYQDILQLGYDFQLKRNRFIRRKDRNGPPYTYDRNDNSGRYDLHCELTPGKIYRQELNEKFYPCLPGKGVADHYNFGETSPTVGAYGPLVADCNHSCHPEIHPYEWLWWRELNPAFDDRPTRRWMVGFFRDMSERFRGWRKPPRVGKITLPFIFRTDQPESSIHVEHLAFSKHLPEGLALLSDIPADALSMDFSQADIQLEGIQKTIHLTTNHPLRQSGMKCWVENVQTDGVWITGQIVFACSVLDMHTFRVSFSEQ